MNYPAVSNESERWSVEQVAALFEQPFNDLLYRAQSVHRRHFRPERGADQHAAIDQNRRLPRKLRLLFPVAHHSTGVAREALMSRERVLQAASKAQQAGATRFCMGAAWRGPNSKELADVVELVKGVRELGMETCVTLACCDLGRPSS